MIKRGDRKIREGLVIRDRLDKTVTVQVSRSVMHTLYGKTVRKTSQFLAHDEENCAKKGDTVRIMETRPISRRKHWRVLAVLGKKESQLA